MPRQRSETANRQSERHNPIGTPQGRKRTDSTQTATSSNSSHYSSKTPLNSANRNKKELSQVLNSPARSNFSATPQLQLSPCSQDPNLLQQQQQFSRDSRYQPQLQSSYVDPNSIASPPAALQRMLKARVYHRRERTNTGASLTPISTDGFPDLETWDAAHDQYLARIQLKRDKSLVTSSMYQGALFYHCLENGLDQTAEQIRTEAGTVQEEAWRSSGIAKWGLTAFRLEQIEPINENSTAKEKSMRYFRLMAGCPIDGWVLINQNEGKAVVAPDSVFNVLGWCHGKSGHGGRDKTHGLLRKYFANVPKEVCQTFVRICPTCDNKRQSTMARVMDEEADFDYGQDDAQSCAPEVDPSMMARGMPGLPQQEEVMSINDWNSNIPYHQHEFQDSQFHSNNRHLNSLGLENVVPTMNFLPPSPYQSQNALHQGVIQHHRPMGHVGAESQLYDRMPARHGSSFLHQDGRPVRDPDQAHRGSLSGSSASGGLGSACGSGSDSTGPNTPASQLDLNWPKDSDVIMANPFIEDSGPMDHYFQNPDICYERKESMGPPPAPFTHQDQQHRSASAAFLTFSDDDPPPPSSDSTSKPSLNRARRPAQLDLSAISNQVMNLENNFQPYGLASACSSISVDSEASIYSAVTEPSIQYRPLLNGTDEAETARVSSSELLPRRFDINNPPSSAPPAQLCFFSDGPDDTLREMQQQRSRERAVLSAAAASGKGKHASLNQGFGDNGSDGDYLPSRRVATPLSAVPPTTTASFGPTYGAVFGNVVGGSGNLFRGQGMGRDGKIESDLMPVTAYGAPDVTVYLNPAYGIPGMSGESMAKSLSAPGATSQPIGEEGAPPIEPALKPSDLQTSIGGHALQHIPTQASLLRPDFLRRHSVAVEQAVVPETSSSLVSVGMTAESAFGQRFPSKTNSSQQPESLANHSPQQGSRSIQRASVEKENGHGRERARHESFEPLSTATSPSDLLEIAKLNGMSDLQSTDASFHYDASTMSRPMGFTARLNMPREVEASSIQFPRADGKGIKGSSSSDASSVTREDMMFSLKNVWSAGTDSTASMVAKAKGSLIGKASSLGIGLGFPSMNFNEANTSTASEESGDSSRGTIRVLRNSSIQSSQSGRRVSSSSTSSGFQPARSRCSSTTKVDKADVQVELNISSNPKSMASSPCSSSSAYGTMRSHSRVSSKQHRSNRNPDENSNLDFLDSNDLMTADELNRLLS